MASTVGPWPFSANRTTNPITCAAASDASTSFSSEGTRTPLVPNCQPDLNRVVHRRSYLNIVLNTQDIVLRGNSVDAEPTRISGVVYLHLSDDTSFRRIHLVFLGKTKINIPADQRPFDSMRSTPQINLKQNFVKIDCDLLSDLGSSSSKSSSLKISAGTHGFPFEMDVPGDLPGTILTESNSISISYTLKASAVRLGKFVRNLKQTRKLCVLRGLHLDSLDYIQSLNIENVWPGKAMYSLSIAHKAHVAGDSIDCRVTFTPLEKGVILTSVTSKIKEYEDVHIRQGVSSCSSRYIAECVYTLPTSETSNLDFIHNPASESIPISTDVLANPATFDSLQPSSNVSLAPNSTPNSNEANCANLVTQMNDNVDDLVLSGDEAAGESMTNEYRNDGEVNSIFSLKIPPGTTPSQSSNRLSVKHKLKWCCKLKNPDGHHSEIHCGVSIHVMSPKLWEEVMTACMSSRILHLSGTAGADRASEAQNALQLPSYTDHVMDRVANADIASNGVQSIRQELSESVQHYSPYRSQPHTPRTSTVLDAHELSALILCNSTAANLCNGIDSDSTLPAPSMNPNSIHEVLPAHPTDWADAELLRSLGELRVSNGWSNIDNCINDSPQSPLSERLNFSANRSRASSSAGSRFTSRSGSRNGSPDRNMNGVESTMKPSSSRSSFSIRPFTRLMRMSSTNPGVSPTQITSNYRNAQDLDSNHQPFSNADLSGDQNISGGFSTPPRSNDEDVGSCPSINTVPSYRVASNGFLGGGVVPISQSAALPHYVPVDPSQN